MNIQNRIKIGFYIVLALVVVALSIWYGNWRDAEMTAAMTTYEDCVKAQYHTTPASWYAEHGVLPECQAQ